MNVMFHRIKKISDRKPSRPFNPTSANPLSQEWRGEISGTKPALLTGLI